MVSPQWKYWCFIAADCRTTDPNVAHVRDAQNTNGRKKKRSLIVGNKSIGEKRTRIGKSTDLQLLYFNWFILWQPC